MVSFTSEYGVVKGKASKLEEKIIRVYLNQILRTYLEEKSQWIEKEFHRMAVLQLILDAKEKIMQEGA